jgi:hypothetical protein
MQENIKKKEGRENNGRKITLVLVRIDLDFRHFNPFQI